MIFEGDHIQRVIATPQKPRDMSITYLRASDYAAAGHLARSSDPDEYFDDSEAATAALIRSHGYRLTSVKEGRLKSADAILNDDGTPFDMKRVSTPTVNAIDGAVRRTRGQAGITFIDASESGFDESFAAKAIKVAARNRGHYLDQIVVALSLSIWVSWWREQ